MKTHDARWLRVRDLFEQAIELPADQRDSFIERNCGDDPSLRDELKSLLAVDAANSDSPLTGAIGAAVDATTRDRRQELLGTVIGPYRLTSVLGHGGAGTVYLGERIDRQYSAQVAVKVVEGAALHAEIGRRFRAERQILANLNHPNIARLIDAGESPQGYPYLVMEYIHGEPINIYCDRLQLNVEQRIELVLKVCTAVHYAHQNLVIHRDLKPGNILVTPDGTPKLLDFGIAKLLDTGPAAAEMALTRLNDRILTPEYASPEQILGQNVTTSSDVYALGVVLYELLSGMRPYRVSSTSQLELERTICINDPTKPSAAIREALNRLKADPTPTRSINTIADSRSATPMRLRSQLDGDLDAIVMRALRKEPVHRYNSVEQLAADLRRHLQRAPVLAREGNWVYYTQRFTRRHIFGVSVAAVFLVVLTAALIVTSVQAKRIAEQRDAANREKQTSEAVASFMVNVFAAADPFTVQNRQVTAGELLDKSIETIRRDLNQEPAVKARLLEAMGRSYSRQGQPEQGIRLIEEAIKIRQDSATDSAESLGATYLNLSKAQFLRNDIDGGARSLSKAKAIFERNPESKEYAHVLVQLGRLELQKDDWKRALFYSEQALILMRKLYGTHHPEVGAVLIDISSAYQWQPDFAAMESTAKEAADIFRASSPELHPDRLVADGMVAEALFSQGLIAQAAPLIENLFEEKKKVFGGKSIRIIEDLNSMVKLRLAQGRLAEAEAFSRQALSVTAQTIGEDNIATGYAKTTLAIVLWKQQQHVAAELTLREALKIYEPKLSSDHGYVTSAQHYLAESLLGQGNAAEAIPLLRKAISALETSSASPWRLARSENTLGQALALAKDYDSAKAILEESYAKLQTNAGADADTISLAKKRLVDFYNLRKLKTNERPHN
jgi:serine/threonine protein kinase